MRNIIPLLIVVSATSTVFGQGRFATPQDVAPIPDVAPVVSAPNQEEIQGAQQKASEKSVIDPAKSTIPGSATNANYSLGDYFDNCDCSTNCQTACNSYCSPSGCGYLSFFGGYVNLQDYQGTATPPPGASFLDPQAISFNNGMGLGLTMGERVRPRIRREAEFTWRNNTADWLDVAATGPQPTSQQVNLAGQVNYFSAMANCLIDLNVFRGHRSNFYGGGGLGFGFVNADILNNNGLVIAYADQSVFAYQAIVGWNYLLSPRVQCFAEYRYFGTDNIHLDVANLNSGTDPNDPTMAADYYDRRFRYLAHNFFFGVRIYVR